MGGPRHRHRGQSTRISNQKTVKDAAWSQNAASAGSFSCCANWALSRPWIRRSSARQNEPRSDVGVGCSVKSRRVCPMQIESGSGSICIVLSSLLPSSRHRYSRRWACQEGVQETFSEAHQAVRPETHSLTGGLPRLLQARRLRYGSAFSCTRVCV